MGKMYKDDTGVLLDYVCLRDVGIELASKPYILADKCLDFTTFIGEIIVFIYILADKY